jgi:2-keto-3-deoxy-L-fuconate dehydrogenase
MKLDSRVAVITGAGSGIGAATASLFASEGATVVLVDRDPTALEASAAGLKEQGYDVLTIDADVADHAAAMGAVGKTLESRGRLDTLVTCAGISSGGTIVSTQPDTWQHVFDVNVKGTYNWIHACLLAMQKAGKGTVVAIASVLADVSNGNKCAYSSSKGAVASTES